MENWNNFGFDATADDTFYLQRIKLHTDVHVGQFLRVYLEGKSALSKGRSLPGGKRIIDVDSIALQQAFFDLRIPFGKDAVLTFRPGRQEFSFGKQRLVSPLPWANTLRTWDGVTGILELNNWNIRGFWSRFAPVRRYSFNKSTSKSRFFGMYGAGKIFSNQFALDLYWLGINRDRQTFNGTPGNESRQTLGGRVEGKIPKTNFDFEMEGAHQFGSLGSADIRAFMFSSVFGYRFVDWKGIPRLWMGFDYASGDHKAGGNVQTFNQLFPLGHPFLGFIDVIARQNSIDVSQGISFKPFQIIPFMPFRHLTFNVDHHLFFRATKADALFNAGGVVIRAGSLGNSKTIGSEVDLTARFSVGRHIDALLGYSHFFSGDFLEESGTSKDINFNYVQFHYIF